MSSTARVFIAGTVTKKQARQAVERDARRKKRRPEPWLLNAYQRRGELQKIAAYRKALWLAIGSDAGWANLVANVCRVINGQVTVEMVAMELAAYGIDHLSPSVIEDAVRHQAAKAWGRYPLFSPAHAGSLIELTSVERDEAGVVKIDACDEDADTRRLRLDRERKARRRAAKAALAPRAESKADMARRLGISRTELYRRIKAGEV